MLSVYITDYINNRTKKQVVSLPHAVFDLHFHPRERTLLGIATSAASVSLYQVARSAETETSTACSDSDSPSPRIQHLWTIQVHEHLTTPALFLAWTPEGWFPSSDSYPSYSSSADGFAVTFSDGRTSVFTAQGGEKLLSGEFTESQFEPRESSEMWFVALAKFQSQPAETVSTADGDGPKAISSPFLFAGNDFGSLHTRRFVPVEDGDVDDDNDEDLNEEEDEENPDLDLNRYEILNFDDKARHHTAGVTCILPLPSSIPLIQDAPLLLTGSYDEYIRVYHANPRTRGKVLAERRLDGGVWRLQLVDVIDEETGPSVQSSEDDHEYHTTQFLVLASCMHAGTRVLCVTWQRRRASSSGTDDDELGKWDIHILAKFTEHQSMNYASDFWKGGGATAEGGRDAQGRKENRRELLCVSSSFYDKRLCLWRVEI
jgi:diphthamide biosynthesis protein 7